MQDSKPNISKIKIEIESENDPFFVAKFEYSSVDVGVMSTSLPSSRNSKLWRSGFKNCQP